MLRRLPPRLALLALPCAWWWTPRSADAHVELLDPPQRYPATNQFDIPLKAPPCGDAANPPGSVPRTVLQSGATITVQWEAFVNHPGHFRLAFDPDGDDDLAGPNGYDDLYTPGTEVLLDGIPVVGGQSIYQAEITLPDVACTTCTLQLIQVMTDKMPWGPEGGSDLYYQCADLILDPQGAGSGGMGTSGGSAGGSGGSGGSTGAATSATGGAGDTSTAGGTGDTGGGTAPSSGGCRTTPQPASTWLLAWLLPALRRRSQDQP